MGKGGRVVEGLDARSTASETGGDVVPKVILSMRWHVKPLDADSRATTIDVRGVKEGS